jgi:hypothetical protein
VFGVSLRTVQRWLDRADGMPLEVVDWSDRPDSPHIVANRTAPDVEEQIIALRQELRTESDLGEYGADAVRREMQDRGSAYVPCERTINRILERKGEFDSRRRVRHASPPPGWYLPDVAAGNAELDQFDVIAGLVIEGGPEIEVLTAISLHGALPGSWLQAAISAKFAGQAMLEHWSAFGCPAYAQFDNDTRFQGAHQHPGTIGRVSRLCLSLGIVPIFVPPRETGFQAAIESLNNRWQQKVWHRLHHDSLESLCVRSERYIAAARRKNALRQEGAPLRHPLPEHWSFDVQAPPQGKMVYLRRTDNEGRAHVLGRVFKVQEHWVQRLVRAEVDLDQCKISFYSLRRREPAQQILLSEAPCFLPNRRFRE